MTDEDLAKIEARNEEAFGRALAVGEIHFETCALSRGAKQSLLAARADVPALIAEVRRLRAAFASYKDFEGELVDRLTKK